MKSTHQQQAKTITGAAILLATASFASRLIGIFRDRIFAHLFGAGDVLDAYYAAFRLPDLVYNMLLVGALSAGFIPVFTAVLLKHKQSAWRVCNSIINILGSLLLIVCIVLFIFTPQITALFVPGFSPEKIQTTIMLTRIMLLSPFILGLSSIVSSTLQSLKSFFIYSLTPIVYNIGIIIGAIGLVPVFGVSGLAMGVVLGALLHLGIQLPVLIRHGWRYRPHWLWANNDVRDIIRLVIPRTLGLATQQINFVVITTIASTLGAGSVAVFHFANHLQSFPIGIFGVSFAVAAFPLLSQYVAQKNISQMRDQVSHTIRDIFFFIVPITILFLLLRAQIVRVLFGSGAFDWEATILTANTLAFFSLSLFAQALIPILGRSFYALKDTWTPFGISIIGVLTNIGFALWLKDTPLIGGVPGLALAFSIAMIVQAALLWSLLHKKIGPLNELDILTSLYKISLAGLLMAPLVQFMKTPLANVVDMTRFWGVATQGFVAGLLGVMTYCGICHLLGVEELSLLTQSFRKRWLKLRHVQIDFTEKE